MAEPIPLDFGLSSDPGRDGAASGPMHWNCFVEPVAEGKPGLLRAADGLTLFTLLDSNGLLRGLHVMAGYLYAVSGTQVFKVSDQGSVSVIGGVAGTGKVVMSRNDASTPQLAIITDEGERFVVSDDEIATISDNDLPTPVSVTYLNQKQVYGIADGRIFWSAVDDLTDIDPLDVTTAEGNPDGLVSAVAHMQEVWVFGSESTEIFRDIGTTFLRNETGVIPRGCLSKHSIKAIDIDLFWIGDDRGVWRARGYAAEQIAPVGVLECLRKAAASSLEAMTYKAWGHDFYVISGTDATTSRTWTWAFNRSTGAWDPKFSYGYTRWRGSEAVNFSNMIIVGDHADGTKLYKVDRDARDEAGNTLIWRARTAVMHAFPNQVCVDRLYLDLVTGVGLNSDDAHASTPYVGLRWSDDGGFTWSRQELRELGVLGQRMTRVSFEALGATEPTGRVWEVEMSSPVIRTLMGARVEGGPCST